MKQKDTACLPEQLEIPATYRQSSERIPRQSLLIPITKSQLQAPHFNIILPKRLRVSVLTIIVVTL